MNSLMPSDDRTDKLIGLLADKLADRLIERSTSTPALEKPCITFGELFGLYYEKHALVRNKRPDNAETFYRTHGIKWKKVPVNKLDRKNLQDWIDKIAITSGPHAANTAINMVSAAINWGIRRGHIPQIENPCRFVEKFPVKSRDRFLVPDELIRLNASLDQEAPVIRDFFRLSLYLGARKSNMLAMTFDSLDFTLAIWRIPDTKNGDDLHLPLSGPALALLKARREVVPSGVPWVFPSDRGKLGHLKEVRRAWRRVLKRAGIVNARIHDLRRSLGSYLAMQGESPYVIGKVLGHRDQRSTAIYARLNLEPVRESMEKCHGNWLSMLEEPAKRPKLLESVETIGQQPIKSSAKNAAIQITGKDQVLVEAKILMALSGGTRTKKELYQKLGAQFAVNRYEMQRILEEMVARQLIYRVRDWQSWKYGLVS